MSEYERNLEYIKALYQGEWDSAESVRKTSGWWYTVPPIVYGDSDYGRNQPLGGDFFSPTELSEVAQWCKRNGKIFKLIVMPNGSSGVDIGDHHFESSDTENCLTKAVKHVRNGV